MEIGALTRPTPVPAAASVLHSDYMSPDVIDRLYPGATHPQILSDSESFPTVANATFDFLIANHVLEHLTNPLRALCEWHRILCPNGLVLLSLPDKRYTFDRRRRRTRLSHLLDDHRSPLPPRIKNLPHLIDWATHVEHLTPHSREWSAWVREQFDNDYQIHNHVWVLQDVLLILLHAYIRLKAQFAIVRWSNTAIRGDEFVLLLRVRKEPACLTQVADVLHICGALAAAWLQDPLQMAQAAVKQLYRRRRMAGRPSA
jgi:SAM-dependent methyltransferase